VDNSSTIVPSKVNSTLAAAAAPSAGASSKSSTLASKITEDTKAKSSTLAKSVDANKGLTLTKTNSDDGKSKSATIDKSKSATIDKSKTAKSSSSLFGSKK